MNDLHFGSTNGWFADPMVKPRLAMRYCPLFLLLLASATVSQAQGLVSFSNIDAVSGVNAPLYLSDGVTPLAGTQFIAELLGGEAGGNLVSIATTGFLTGVGAGYFFGGDQAIPGVPRGNTASVEVRVWNTGSGSSFAAARASGLADSWWESAVFSVVVGGGTVNPSAAAPLAGLGNGPVYLNSVPEPPMLALVVLGACLGFAKVLNKSMHRMSGDNVNLNFGRRETPLIGGVRR